MSNKNLKICSNCSMIVDYEHDCPIIKKRRNKQKAQYNRNHKETLKELQSTKWRRFRKKIIIRDSGYCQRCYKLFKTYTYGPLEVHHIKPRVKHPQLMYDDKNVVTVCKQCNDLLGLKGIDFQWTPPATHVFDVHI